MVLLSRKEHYLTERLAFFESGQKKMSQDLSTKSQKLQEIEAKGEMFDRVHNQAAQLERDNVELAKQNALHVVTIKVNPDLQSTKLLSSPR